MKNRPGKDRLVLLAFLLILLVFGALVARKYLVSVPPAPAPVGEEPRQRREVILYFGARDGTHLAAEAREIEDCLVESDCLRETVQALVDGPVGDLVPLFPSHTVVKRVEAAGGTATVDLGRELATGHPGGSLSELLTVYSLANTLAANFPHLRQVRLLLDGQPAETLKGHVDLRAPIQADFGFNRPPAGAARAGSEESGGER